MELEVPLLPLDLCYGLQGVVYQFGTHDGLPLGLLLEGLGVLQVGANLDELGVQLLYLLAKLDGVEGLPRQELPLQGSDLVLELSLIHI